MKKEIIRYIAILLSFATVIAVFTACAKKDNKREEDSEREEQKEEQMKEEQINKYLLIKDDKIYYRKNEQDDYFELATDADGVTVVDEYGNLLWKVTDANGNDQTHPVSYPLFLVEGNKMACQQFTITCPKGWESTGSINFRMKNEKENKSIEYSFYETTEKDYKTPDEMIAFLEEQFKPMVEEGTAKLTRTETRVAGRDATKLTIEVNNKGESSYMEIYYVENKNGHMCFTCFCDYEDKGFNFKAILDTIEYRY